MRNGFSWLLVLVACTPSGGLPDEAKHRPTPSPVLQSPSSGRGMLGDVVQLDTAGRASCALTSTGTIFCWGQLTREQTDLVGAPLFGQPAARPVLIEGPSATRLTVSPEVVTMLAENQEVFAFGEIGDGWGQWRAFRNTGIDHATRMMKSEGSFDGLCWLRNGERRLCRGAPLGEAPERLPAGVYLDERAPTCFATTTSVQCGEALAGCDGDPMDKTIRFEPGDPVVAMQQAGATGACALTRRGRIECADSSLTGSVATVGCGGKQSVSTSEDTFAQLRCGWTGPFKSMAVQSRCEGGFGLLADGTVVELETDLRVEGAAQIVELTPWSAHVCGLRVDGTVSCWGANDVGQLGVGEVSDEPHATATRVLGPATTPVSVGRGPERRVQNGVWTSMHTDVPQPELCPTPITESGTVTVTTTR